MKGLLLEIPLIALVGWFWLYTKLLERRGRRSPFNEPILRAPAHSAQKIQIEVMVDMLFYMVGVAAGPFFVAALISQSTIANWIIVAIGAIFVGFCFVRATLLFRTMITRRLGVDAEMAVGSELNLLMRDGAWVFHDIPYPYGNIDHVIVGNGGVFAVETKGYSKPTNTGRSGAENATMTAVGDVLQFPTGTRTKAPMAQANVHAKWLRQEIQRRFGITVPVRAVVALPGWMVSGGFDGECWVINPKRGNALRSAVTKPVIDEAAVKTVAAWLESPDPLPFVTDTAAVGGQAGVDGLDAGACTLTECSDKCRLLERTCSI